ncbi:hypothetical protein LJR090_003356 [Bosea sp. LjRoot90]|uniref:hypothetical protein n=1 Tax=Bosea sp. LjRoot90 TaxID=3342342 RepID=UPI003ED15A10
MILIGVVHSALGEILIFRRLRAGTIVPLLAPPPLRERHLRILWANWHLCSVLGWALAALLILFAMSPDLPAHALHIRIIAIATFAGAMLVLFATKGRHPGWFGLLVAAGLAWLGQGAP